MGDPMRKDNGVADAAALKRPNGGILIQYNPNTGGISIDSKELFPIEEIGLLQWAIAMRMGAHLNTEENQRIALASKMPAGPKVQH